MPDVIVRHNTDYLKNEDLNHFFSSLQIIIAKVLNVPGTDGELSPEDIVVRSVPHSPYDLGTMDLEITIMTNDMQERREKLDKYPEKIVKQILKLNPLAGFMKTGFKKGKNNVWVILVPGAFKVF